MELLIAISLWCNHPGATTKEMYQCRTTILQCVTTEAYEGKISVNDCFLKELK